MSTDTLSTDPMPRQDSVVDVFVGDIKRASASALVLSLVVHAMLWIIAALVVVGHGGSSNNADGAGDSGPIEMAVVTEGELSKLQDTAIGMATPTVPDAAVKDVDVATNIPDAGPSEVRTGGEGVSDVGALTGGGDVGIGGGEGSGMGGSGSGGASFFGIEAQGNRFAYLVDVSGSMQEALLEETRITTLKKELIRSIGALESNSLFFAVAFSSEAQSLTEKKEWTEASAAGKKKIRPVLDPLLPNGGTNPLPGFEMIFSMKPRPDAIYFMTDGEFAPEVVEEVARLNAKTKIPIHCICLGSRTGEDNMRKISKGSHGTFNFIGGPP